MPGGPEGLPSLADTDASLARIEATIAEVEGRQGLVRPDIVGIYAPDVSVAHGPDTIEPRVVDSRLGRLKTRAGAVLAQGAEVGRRVAEDPRVRSAARGLALSAARGAGIQLHEADDGKVSFDGIDHTVLKSDGGGLRGVLSNAGQGAAGQVRREAPEIVRSSFNTISTPKHGDR